MKFKLLFNTLKEIESICNKQNIDLEYVNIQLDLCTVCVNVILPGEIHKIEVNSIMDYSFNENEILKNLGLK